MRPLAMQDRCDLRRLPQAVAEFARSGKRLPGHRGGVPLRGDQGLAHGNLEFQLAPVALLASVDLGDNVEAFLQMRHRLEHGRPRQGLLPSLEPIPGALPRQPSLGAVMSQKFWLRNGGTREQAFQTLDNPFMQLTAGQAEQRRIGGILH
jgi:hypothetical protein